MGRPQASGQWVRSRSPDHDHFLPLLNEENFDDRVWITDQKLHNRSPMIFHTSISAFIHRFYPPMDFK
jgi:hypothetical protein